MNDVIIGWTQSIQRCVLRAREERRAAGEGFAENYTRQDAALLNVTRACEQSIDLANYIIPNDLRDRLVKMVGFRNTAVHQYQKLDMRIVCRVIDTGLDDLVRFTGIVIRRFLQS